MTKQVQLIGEHPADPNHFGKWLIAVDHKSTTTQCYRELQDTSTIEENELIEWMSNQIIVHHYRNDLIERLKQKYKTLGFADYSENHRMIPNTDKVMKGNTAEIILSEYLKSSINKPLASVYRFHFSNNVDQSMKGDDVLLVDCGTDASKTEIYLGEAKFRKTPNKAIIKEVADSLQTDTKPLSFTALVQRLLDSEDSKEEGEILDNVVLNTIRDQGQITYAGFVMSNENVAGNVLRNLASTNSKLIFLSLGIENPEELIVKSFAKAQEKLDNPDTL